MKSVSKLIHGTPWWLLLLGGCGLFVALVLYAIPFNIAALEHRGATAEENRAIKSEINSAFSESALDIARGVVQEMRERTRDPDRRQELDQALEEIDNAKDAMREAGAEALRAKRDAADQVSEAVRQAHRAIADARREAEPLPVPPPAPTPPAKKSEHVANISPGIEIHVDTDADKGGAVVAVPLPPELKDEIRRSVSGDLYRIGMGAAMILIFIPLFILTIIAKFFIDRSHAAQALAETKRREADYARMSQQVTEAKLSALQAQVEPHFLYNTLASVQALTEVDPQQANAMTGHLIQYLRNALPKMRESVSTVGQEVELVRAYLNILQMRMGKRLTFEIDVPQELMDAPFPPLMLPSLVENAIKLGLEPQREGGNVKIAAAAADGTLRVSVADTGRGFAEAPGAGVGLANIRERLAALYGDAGHLTLEAREPHGVVATIEVPRDGARAPAPVPPGAEPAAPPAPQTATARTLAVIGTAERAWRKGLSFAFIVLVVIAAVFAGLAVMGIVTGMIPVHLGEDVVGGPTGAVVGTVGIAVAFAVVVIAIAIVLAVVYGLGFLMVGLAIFIPVMILVSLAPALAPLILCGLAIWWIWRRQKEKKESAGPAP
ncbi:MAG TPA: histidine kinase [Usitatibacter sp.]|nr:histidine kinase [Usitatibacter sp.]